MQAKNEYMQAKEAGMKDISILRESFNKVNSIDPELFTKYDVKRGLRNANGTGVLTGLTNISNVYGYKMVDGEKIPDQGELILRGYKLTELIDGLESDGRFGFEEIVFLLLSGKLPSVAELEAFRAEIDEQRELLDGFTSTLTMHNVSPDVMNVLARSILMFYAKDPQAEDRSPEHEILTAIQLISRLPRVMVNAYHALNAAFNQGSFVIHPFIPGQSTSETILSMLRMDRQFTPEEAKMLDVMLCLHAEHGGGNNSTFTCRVLSSADTDPYSAYAAAIGSLKGSRHGGANHKVIAMQREAAQQIKDWSNDGQVRDYLARVLRKEAFDRTGLIYGMGHAVYTLSDPRAVICKKYAHELAKGTPFEEKLALLESIERLSPEVFSEIKGSDKQMCANIDMYSGLVYTMLGIPEIMFTPLFACSRMAGWAAHRFEEIVSGKRIIRPAFRTVEDERTYIPIGKR